MTLPGTYARLLAVTWGKPVSGCFSGLWLDWIFFLAFWPVGFGILPARRFCQFFFSFGHPSTFGLFVDLFAMGVECVKTCVIHASEMMANYEKARVIALLRESIDFERLSAIQFCPRGLIRITFKNASDKEDFARMGSLALDGHDLSVTSSDKPPSLVYVHYFPAEGNDALICDELSKYGEIVNIKHQSFSGIPGLLTGSRILTMVLSDPVPAEFRIDDYPVRVWYRGIPPFCQICKVNGHKAADCQFNGKCRRCGSPDHKAHACTRPWGHSVVPMEVAVPVVVPDPPETVVPAVSDSSVLDECVDEPVEDVEDEAPVAENVAVVGEIADVVEEVEVADKEEGEVVDEDVEVGTPAGAPVLCPSGRVSGSVPSVPVVEAVSTCSVLSPVASCRIFTPELRRKFFVGYRAMLCRCSGNAAFVFSHKDFKLCGVSPADDPDRVRITYENGAVSIVDTNLIRMSKVDTSDEPSEVEFAQFILKVKDDPSYRISFRGSIVDMVGPTEHSNVLWVEFSDHTGLQCRKLPAKALSVKNIALKSNSSGINNVNEAPSPSAGANVNNVNKADDGFVNVARSSSRSVVPTAAVLAAELLKRATPPSVVGVPKCRKKL